MSCDTAMPRAASRSLSLCSVRCGTSSSCASTKSRCGSSVQVRYPPNLAGAALPVSRSRFDHFATADGAIAYCSAIVLQLSPDAIAAATRCLRSLEYGFAMHAGPSPACSLNHDPPDLLLF